MRDEANIPVLPPNEVITTSGSPALLVMNPRVTETAKSTDDAPLTLLTADPITWSVVATALAKGAASWVGKKLMESAFGSKGVSAADIANLVVKELAAHLRGVLREHDLMLLARNYSFVLRLLEDYGRTGGASRLEKADLDSIALVAALSEYRRAASALYAAAVMLRLNVLQTITLENIRDERPNIQSLQSTHFPILHDLLASQKNLNQRRIGLLWLRVISNSRDGVIEFGFVDQGVFEMYALCQPNHQQCFEQARRTVEQEIERRKQFIIGETELPLTASLEALRVPIQNQTA